MDTCIQKIRPGKGVQLLTFLGLFVLGSFFFALAFGVPILNSSWTGWLYISKRMQYEAAWLAYRDEPWSFPLGHLSQFFYPIGSSIAYMDGAPWYLTILKICKDFIPAWFSVWGSWILLCCILQAFAAFFLMKALTRDTWVRWGGTILLTINPVLVERSTHFALLAHWLLLGTWFLFFSDQKQKTTQQLWLVLLAIVAGIHPYLAAMIMPIRLGALFIEKFEWKPVLKQFVCSMAVLIGVFILFGYFSNGSTRDEGADFFTADLLTFINSVNKSSSFIPSFTETIGENEGFGYLGAGGFLLALSGFIFITVKLFTQKLSLQNTWTRKVLIALGIAFVLSIYALGRTIKVAGIPIVFNPFYIFFSVGKLKLIPLIFRAPGRFIWPLYYLSIALGSLIFRRKKILLLAILVLQFVDIGPYISERHARFASGYTPPVLKTFEVRHLVSTANKIIFVPSEPRTVCGAEPSLEADEILIALLPISASLNIPMNSGLQARTPSSLIRPICGKFLEEVLTGNFEDGTVYVVDTALVDKKYYDSSNAFSCKKFNMVSICGQFQHRFPHKINRVYQLVHHKEVIQRKTRSPKASTVKQP